ncbi:hypothetical protein JHK86_015522 [Glycine max]|nr:hypothetical protein JHK86_015522 [Glycine max]
MSPAVGEVRTVLELLRKWTFAISFGLLLVFKFKYRDIANGKHQSIHTHTHTHMMLMTTPAPNLLYYF